METSSSHHLLLIIIKHNNTRKEEKKKNFIAECITHGYSMPSSRLSASLTHGLLLVASILLIFTSGFISMNAHTPLYDKETITLVERDGEFSGSDLFGTSLGNIVSQKEITIKVDELTRSQKRSRTRCCALQVLFLVLGVASTISSRIVAPAVACKSTVPCRSDDRSKCIENGQLVGCIVTCCNRNNITDKCTLFFPEFQEYANMVKSSQTFELNNSNGITTNDYCDCDAPDYVNKGRSKDELCAGNVKLAGNIEKQGNSNLQQLLIVSGLLNYLLVFCSMFCFCTKACGPLHHNTSRVFRSWKEQKGIDAEYVFKDSNYCCPLCLNDNCVRFHVPIDNNK